MSAKMLGLNIATSIFAAPNAAQHILRSKIAFAAVSTWTRRDSSKSGHPYDALQPGGRARLLVPSRVSRAVSMHYRIATDLQQLLMVSGFDKFSRCFAASGRGSSRRPPAEFTQIDIEMVFFSRSRETIYGVVEPLFNKISEAAVYL